MTITFSLGLVAKGMTGCSYITSWKQDGRDVTVDLEYAMTTLADAKTIRSQLLGYLDAAAGQPVLPLTWSEDAELDGFYKVESGSVSMDPSLFLSFRVKASLKLLQLSNYQQPLIESVSYGARSGFLPARVTGEIERPWVAIPWSWDTREALDASGDLFTITKRYLTATNYMTVYESNAHGLYNDIFLSTCAASEYYDGAVTLKTPATSGNYVTAQRGYVTNEDWVIDNGLIKLYGAACKGGMNNHFAFIPRALNGTADYNGTFELQIITDSTNNHWQAEYYEADATRILRNTPEQVSIEQTFKGAPGTDWGWPYHIKCVTSLRRGARSIRVGLTSAYSRKLGLEYGTLPTGQTWTTYGGSACGCETSGTLPDNMLAYPAWTGITPFIAMGANTTADGETLGYQHGYVLATIAAKFKAYGVGMVNIGAASTSADYYLHTAGQFAAAQGETMRVSDQ